MKTYLFSYNYDGASYGFEIRADTLDEAKMRLARLQFATYDGELVAKIGVPTWLGKVIAWVTGK